MKASAAARLVLAFTLAALSSFASFFALEGTDLDEPATAGASYRKTRLACIDFARRGPGGLDVVSRSRISRLHFR